MMACMSFRILAGISLPACEFSSKAKDVLGQRFKLKASKEAIVRKGRDIDYSSYAVGFGVGMMPPHTPIA